jgi:DNA polymerase-3 subunit gamma/tau
MAPDYGDVLAGLATLLQQIAVVQVAGFGALDVEAGGEGDVDILVRLAAAMAPETVQLMYQIAVTGRRDLVLAPDPRTGFEMALLRMVAFHPERQQPAMAAAAGVPAPARPVPGAPGPAGPSPGVPAQPSPKSGPAKVGDIRDWPAFVQTLSLDGAARQLAAHCALVAQSPFELRLTLAKRNDHLLTDNLRNRLVAAVQERLGSAVKVQFAVAEAAQDTPAARQAQTEDEELRLARERIASDSNVKQMAELFGAEVIPESIRKNPSPRK